MKLTLPFPPSVNSLYATNWKTKRRFKSKRYEAWISAATIKALTQRWQSSVPEFTGHVKVVYELGRPDLKRRDVENYSKAISDFLVYHNILADDSLIHEITLRWADVEGVEITITEITK